MSDSTDGPLDLVAEIFGALFADDEGRVFLPEPAIEFVMTSLELAFRHSRAVAEEVYSDVANAAVALEEEGFPDAAETLMLILLQAEPLAEEAGFSGRDAIERARAKPTAALLGREAGLRAPKVGEKAPAGTFKVGMIPPGGRRI